MNKVAIWRPCGSNKLNIRKMPLGTSYRQEGSPVYQATQADFYRYAKDYSVSKIKFSLFLRTTSEDAEAVESFLDQVAKNLTKVEVLEKTHNADLGNFTYLQEYFKEGEK